MEIDIEKVIELLDDCVAVMVDSDYLIYPDIREEDEWLHIYNEFYDDHLIFDLDANPTIDNDGVITLTATDGERYTITLLTIMKPNI